MSKLHSPGVRCGSWSPERGWGSGFKASCLKCTALEPGAGPAAQKGVYIIWALSGRVRRRPLQFRTNSLWLPAKSCKAGRDRTKDKNYTAKFLTLACDGASSPVTRPALSIKDSAAHIEHHLPLPLLGERRLTGMLCPLSIAAPLSRLTDIMGPASERPGPSSTAAKARACMPGTWRAGVYYRALSR